MSFARGDDTTNRLASPTIRSLVWRAWLERTRLTLELEIFPPAQIARMAGRVQLPGPLPCRTARTVREDLSLQSDLSHVHHALLDGMAFRIVVVEPIFLRARIVVGDGGALPSAQIVFLLAKIALGADGKTRWALTR